jgi:hypothetical protein
MTRKHFEAFAKYIANIDDAKQRRQLAEAVAQVCFATNSSFNRSKFFAACNLEA